jgi:hypothetical protein
VLAPEAVKLTGESEHTVVVLCATVTTGSELVVTTTVFEETQLTELVPVTV